MIYTRFGGQVKILKDNGEGWLKVIRHEDEAIREWHISELKADNGIKEIQEEIDKLKHK